MSNQTISELLSEVARLRTERSTLQQELAELREDEMAARTLADEMKKEYKRATSRVAELEKELLAAKELLVSIRKTIDDSEAWWMDCPDRGGFDTDAIDAVIERLTEKGKHEPQK